MARPRTLMNSRCTSHTAPHISLLFVQNSHSTWEGMIPHNRQPSPCSSPVGMLLFGPPDLPQACLCRRGCLPRGGLLAKSVNTPCEPMYCTKTLWRHRSADWQLYAPRQCLEVCDKEEGWEKSNTPAAEAQPGMFAQALLLSPHACLGPAQLRL